MPELPEVETMVRGIRDHAEGRVITRTQFCRCRRKPIAVTPSRNSFVRRTRGVRINQVLRIAKRIVFSLSTGDFIVIEPRMTGLMLVSDPPTTDHLRIRWHLESQPGSADTLQFWDRRGLGTASLLSPEQYRALHQRLGCDALTVNSRTLGERLASTRRELKVTLLDQSVISGIGNLYASEILHLAGLSPFRVSESLTTDEVRQLTRAVRRVLRNAIRYEGSTLGDGTYRNALNQDGSYQNHHRVYQRTDERCVRCRRGTIRRVVQAQRSTFFCDHCQT